MAPSRKHPTDYGNGWFAPIHGVTQDQAEQLESILGHEGDPHPGWRTVENCETGQRAILRLKDSLSDHATVTAVIVLPIPADEGVTSRAMRAVPVAALQSWYRENNTQIDATIKSFMTVHPPSDLRGIQDPEPDRPIERTERDDTFYALVAMQYRKICEVSPRPTRDFARVNGIKESTAQRWLWEARKRKFLAPGRPGRRVKAGNHAEA